MCRPRTLVSKVRCRVALALISALPSVLIVLTKCSLAHCFEQLPLGPSCHLYKYPKSPLDRCDLARLRLVRIIYAAITGWILLLTRIRRGTNINDSCVKVGRWPRLTCKFPINTYTFHRWCGVNKGVIILVRPIVMTI